MFLINEIKVLIVSLLRAFLLSEKENNCIEA